MYQHLGHRQKRNQLMEMAYDSIGVYERYRLRFGLGCLSVLKIIRYGHSINFRVLSLGHRTRLFV